eukprot:423293_1
MTKINIKKKQKTLISMSNTALSDKFEDLESCNLNDCKSLKRLRQILHFTQCIAENNDKNKYEIQTSLIEYIENNKYEHLLNDYHHIITKHLNNKDPIVNDKNYQIINDKMTHVIKCDINKCNLYKRNGMDRETNAVKNINNPVDKKGAVIMELLDNIHTHLVHSFDTGYRIRVDMDQKSQPNDNTQDTDEINSQMTTFKFSIDNKRKQLENIRGKDTIQHNKFITNFENESNSNNDEKQINDNKNEIETANNFSFGIKFYYWNWYKNNKDNDPDNRGYKYGDMYIEKKYNNLKEEI